MGKRTAVKGCLIILVAAVSSSLLFLGWSVHATGKPVRRGNYDKIHIGMTEAQVEGVLGKPGEELPPLNYEDLDTYEDRDLLVRTSPHRLCHWQNDTHMITVFFDPEGRTVGKSYSRDPRVGLFQRFIDWLGL